MDLRGRDRRGRLRQGGPDEADQLAREGDHGDRGPFPVPDQVPVPPVEPELRLPRLREDGFGLALAPAREGGAQPRRVAVVPGRLDQNPPRVRVAGFGDAAPPLPIARRVLISPPVVNSPNVPVENSSLNG
jgi:hypothetical protein